MGMQTQTLAIGNFLFLVVYAASETGPLVVHSTLKIEWPLGICCNTNVPMLGMLGKISRSEIIHILCFHSHEKLKAGMFR